MIRASILRALVLIGGLLAMLPGVGNAQQTASDYSVCFVAVSRSLRDWDRNCQQCQPYIGEAMRRGLSVERCMQLFDRRDHMAAGQSRPAPAAAPAPVPLVAVVQQLLAALGLNPGPADGVPGPQTEAAVRAFQRAQGFRETGVIDEDLRRQLQAAASRNAPGPGNNDGYKLASTGTGFYISAKGTVITNEHVVRGCKRIGLAKRGLIFASARPFALNRQDDLAILTTDQTPPIYLRVRVAEPLKVAEQVLAFGYPLAPVLLSTLGNTTIGNVTALAGIQDNYRVFQLSAPIQPGNSGGPVLDMQGRLIGVVFSTIQVEAVFGATRTLPQNVNFAVKGTTLISFLEAQGVSFEPAEPASSIETTRVAELANDASMQIACYK
jgi:S1-C subfamily serine protease